MCERVTRSAARTKNMPDDAVNANETHSTLDHCDLCSKCQKSVSRDIVSVRCEFCGHCVHAECDETLTVQSLKMVNDDRHPSICYQCPNCRTSHLVGRFKSANSAENDKSFGMEIRMSHLEEQLKQITAVLQHLLDQNKCLPTATQKANPNNLTAASRTRSPVKLLEAKKDIEIVTRKNSKSKSNIPVISKNKVASSKAALSVICTNVPEATDTLLANRHEHDMSQWDKLCSRMSLKPIKPVSLTRLSRKPGSVHNDKPRLLKVAVQNEKELEDILLSAYLLRDCEKTDNRIFADVPWKEREKSAHKGKHREIEKGKSLLILNIPEPASDSDMQCQNKHDYHQWKYLSDAIEANNEAVIDIFRIPKSPKYEGNGPRPLKLTFLTTAMADTVYKNWNRFRYKLPREIRILHRNTKPQLKTTEVPDNEQNQAQEPSQKNHCLPAPIESAA